MGKGVDILSILSDEELKDIEKKTQNVNKQPDWVSSDENGRKHLKSSKLGQDILLKNPIIRTPALMNGAYFNGRYWERLNSRDELNTRIFQLVNRSLDKYGLYNTKNSREVREWITNESFVSVNVFQNKEPWLIPFKNGTYNLKTDKLQKANAKNYILGGFDYDLDTTGKEPKVINSLIKYMVGDGAQFLTEYIGYMFYRSYEPFNKFVVLQGEPGNGKSTLNNQIIKPLIHEKNTSHLSLEELTSTSDNARFNVADLLGHFANVFMDLKKVYIASPDQLKNLTGGDTVNARFKGGSEFPLTNFATFLFAANDLPMLRDDSGVFSRALILPTIAPVVRDNPVEQDKRAKLFPDEQIQKELPTFAYYALRKFKKAMDKGELNITETMKEVTKKWRYSDPLSMFLEEQTQQAKVSSGGITVSRLYDELKAWFYDSGLSVPSKRSVIEVLAERGIDRRKTRIDEHGASNTPQWRFIGLDILPDDEK